MAAFQKNFPPKTKTVMHIQRISKGRRSKAPLYEDTNLSEPVKKVLQQRLIILQRYLKLRYRIVALMTWFGFC